MHNIFYLGLSGEHRCPLGYLLFLQKCLLSSPPCFILFLSKSLDLIGLQGNIKGKFSNFFSKFFFSETIRRMKLKLGILA